MHTGADYQVTITVTALYWAKDYLDAVQFGVKISKELQKETLNVGGERCIGLAVTGIDVESVGTDERDD